MKSEDKRFPRADLISFKLTKWPNKIGNKLYWKPMYCRMSNASQIYFMWFNICWRMPWLPHVAYSMGWDAHFRLEHKLGEYAPTPWNHVYPNKDLKEHVLEGIDCHCEPKIDWENRLVIHNAYDMREITEFLQEKERND